MMELNYLADQEPSVMESELGQTKDLDIDCANSEIITVKTSLPSSLARMIGLWSRKKNLGLLKAAALRGIPNRHLHLALLPAFKRRISFIKWVVS